MNRPTISDPIAVQELFSCVVNSHKIWVNCSIYILDNLRKKYAKGIYDKSRAVTAWEVAATRMAKLYAQTLGNDAPYYVYFNAATRRACAVMLEEYYFEEVQE